MKFWYELTVCGKSDSLSDYEEQLENNSKVLAMTFSSQNHEDEIFEPEPGQFPLWQENRMTLLFDNENAAFEIISDLQLTPDQYEIKILPNEDWISKCHDLFQPKQFGKRIWLYPSWSKPPMPDAINICLDPGMAFGTGEHETTTLCLEWLDRNLKPGTTVVDYGCGTAVLAIAAAKLGAINVLAVDIDEQAVTAAKENVKKNNVEEIVKVFHTSEFKVSEKYDVVLANILARPLIQLKKHFSELMHLDSFLITSGVLASQFDWIKENYESDFNCIEKNNLNNWLSICFKKKN